MASQAIVLHYYLETEEGKRLIKSIKEVYPNVKGIQFKVAEVDTQPDPELAKNVAEIRALMAAKK